jgi:MOSC domain-containing protein YiiM
VHVESIALGLPRVLRWAGRDVRTSIFKSPVPGPVWARGHNLEGDGQSDLRVHGGEWKAVYSYAAEHEELWAARLGRPLESAQFGQNLTTRGLDEAEVAIGDVFRFGEALLQATEPRLPCYKLGMRLADSSMVKAFAEAGRFGLYFRIVGEGRITAGDRIERIRRPAEIVPVYSLAHAALHDALDLALLLRLSEVPELSPSWRSQLAQLIARRPERQAAPESAAAPGAGPPPVRPPPGGSGETR